LTAGSEVRIRIAISAYPTCIRDPIRGGGFPPNIVMPFWTKKTRMAWLPDGEKILKISLFVLTQLTNVTDGHTHRRTETA